MITVYMDVDDTVLAQILPGSGFDLRPCAITHLRVLGRIFDCCWLTCWPYRMESGISVQTLIESLYGQSINESFRYADWDRDHPDGKAGFVLRPDQPANWYWLEDPIARGEREALVAAGKLDRYIAVEPQGPWGLLDGINRLFDLTGIRAADLERAGARPEWFDPSRILARP